MEIETFYPEHPLLKECIAYYYFQKTDSADFTADYYAFPNVIQALNIHKNITCEINSHDVKVTAINENNYTMILQGRFERPLHVQQKGKINKVTIIFKPLGLNHFIAAPYLAVAAAPTQLFLDWITDMNYPHFINSFFIEEDQKERISILEDFLISKYTLFEGAIILQQIVTLLSDFDNPTPISEIAKRMQLNTRTFNRLFHKHLGISAAGYRKIARFRHSIKNKISDSHFTTLTRIGYQSDFYDQSYFNKVYKKVTGQNPSSFFKSIDKLADNQLVFKFVNKE